MPANLENSAVATGLEKVSFHLIPKKGNAKELMLLNCVWCWRRLLRIPWTARRSNQSIPKEISPGISFFVLFFLEEMGKVEFYLILFLKNFYFYFILLYNTVLVLPYIDMNPPRVYMCSQT